MFDNHLMVLGPGLVFWGHFGNFVFEGYFGNFDMVLFQWHFGISSVLKVVILAREGSRIAVKMALIGFLERGGAHRPAWPRTSCVGALKATRRGD